MKRKNIEEKYKWNLEQALKGKTVDFWKKQFSENCEVIISLRGKITKNIENFSTFEEASKDLDLAAGIIGIYIMNKMNEDTGNAEATKNALDYEQFVNKYVEQMSSVENEILENANVIRKYLKNDKFKSETAAYERSFRHIPHKLSDVENELLSKLSTGLGAPGSIFDKLNDADIDFGYIKDADGKKIHLTQGNYSKYMKDKSTDVRKAAFLNHGEEYKKHQHTLSMIYYTYISNKKTLSKISKFEDGLEASLFSDNVPRQLYTNLIDKTKSQTHLVKKWRTIVSKVLKLDVKTASPWDWTQPLCDASDRNYTIEEGIEIIREALQPLGKKYIEKFDYLINARWIDFYPTDNKTSGAYSSSQWDTPAFILMNWTGKLRDVATLAHEIGHSIHSMFSNEKQTQTYHSYPIFLAEVASITNEYLLTRHLLKISTDNEEKKAILENTIGDFVATVFRQVQFAEFEMLAHDIVNKGGSLTSDILLGISRKLNIEYYPRLKDENDSHEFSGLWALFVPHFYMNFYVYKYATGLITAYSMGESILNNEPGAIDKYISFLSSGGRNFPIDTLKEAGVDLEKDSPYNNAFSALSKLISEFEKIAL